MYLAALTLQSTTANHTTDAYISASIVTCNGVLSVMNYPQYHGGDTACEGQGSNTICLYADPHDTSS